MQGEGALRSKATLPIQISPSLRYLALQPSSTKALTLRTNSPYSNSVKCNALAPMWNNSSTLYIPSYCQLPYLLCTLQST